MKKLGTTVAAGFHGRETVRHLIMGVGAWCYPKSRESIGIYALNRFAERNKMSWEYVPEICCDILPPEKGLVVVKPKTYLPQDMGRALMWAMQFFRVRVRDVNVLHYDMGLPSGKTEITRGKIGSRNDHMESIFDVLGSDEELRRASIGVGHVTRDKLLIETIGQAMSPANIMSRYDTLFLKNVLPEDEQPLVDEAVDALLDEVVGIATLGHSSLTRLNSL